MAGIRLYVRRYWQVIVTLLSAAIGLGLESWLSVTAGHWLLAVMTCLLLLPLLWEQWGELQAGSYGINLIGPVAIVTALALHQYWTAIALLGVLNTTTAIQLEITRRQDATAATILFPSLVQLIRGRKLVAVEVERIHAGDKLMISSDEIIPVDGELLDDADIDESVSTGRQAARRLHPGELVLAGSRNLSATVTIRATSGYHDSLYAQNDRFRSVDVRHAPFIRSAHLSSLLFMGAALLIAGGAWFHAHQALRFLDVLAIATPAPFLFSVPAALRLGLRRSLADKTFYRSAATFERLAAATTWVLADDSVLTASDISVRSIEVEKSYRRQDVLALIAGLATDTSSLYNRAIQAFTAAESIHPTRLKHIRTLPSGVVQATHDGKQLSFGSASSLANADLAAPGHSGDTAWYLLSDTTVAASIDFKASSRPEAKTAIQQLRSLDVKTLASLSHTMTSKTASNLGVDDLQTGLTPGDALRYIDTLEPKPIVVVGGSESVAPLMTAADLGIAVHVQAADSVYRAAQVIVMSDDLRVLARALRTAQRSLATAKQAVAIGSLLNIAVMVSAIFLAIPLGLCLLAQVTITLLAIAYPQFILSTKRSVAQ